MGFLAPWFLIGGLAVGLPLWLHLLRRYKRTPEPFSSLMFFERSTQSSVKHRRLRYLVLLSLRMLLLLLLALAFASPFVNRTTRTAQRRTLTVIAIDRSFSMRYGDRMARAKSAATRLLDGLPGQALVQVAALDAQVESLTRPGVASSGAKAAIETIQANDRASSFGEFARALRALQQTSGMQLDAHLISDMQQSSMPTDFHDLQAGPYVTLHMHRVGEGMRPNWAVENVVAPASVDGTTAPRVAATIAGWGTPAETRAVSLVLDGKTAATAKVQVAANGQAPVEFEGFPVSYGRHKGEIRIEPHDELPQDDGYSFSMEREEARRALLLYAGERGGGSFYYKSALESGTHAGFTVEALSASNAEGQDFGKFAFVVLSDVGELDGKLADELCAYVEKGGSVLITLGQNTAARGTIPLSKEQFSEQRQRQAAGYVDSGHPALASGGKFENVQFSETAWLTPKPDARVLARFADGSPLLLEERAGEGRKLILASTIDNSTSDFALHASFVPFVVQTARYLAHSEDQPSSVTAGTPIELRRASKTGATADVIGPDGKHELTLDQATKAPSFEAGRSGFYEISRADGRRLLVAVDADRRESDLRAVPDETLELWRNTGDTGQGARETSEGTETRPWSFWRPLLIAALLAAAVESIFARRYLEEERQTV